MLMPVTVALGIGLAIAAPLVYHLIKQRAGILLGLLVLTLFAFFLFALPATASNRNLSFWLPWAPSLGLWLAFYLDGLSHLMALIILGIGGLVVIYGAAYLKGHAFLPRFLSLTLLFMSAMLGLVLSDNALLLFIFWELTSISSFLLIGFDHHRASARSAAWQALLVTGAGGLALLAGVVLVYIITGSFEIRDWIGQAQQIQQSALAPAAFVLILVGAMAKSAQFPFHFWLPNAMEAPTPVSAYLHSATMVKAGVYLIARLSPVFAGLVIWESTVPWVGMATLVAGSLLALGQTDLKRLLAYSTVGALGALIFLFGLGTPLAVKTGMVFLLAHALYKGALFLVAGGVDHAVHNRDIRQLGGLAKHMPFTATAAGIAALSMAGLPPFIGFIAKELVYENTLKVSSSPTALTALTLIALTATAAVAGWVGFSPFWSKPSRELHSAEEGSPALWLAPMILALLGLGAGLFPQTIADAILRPSAEAVLLSAQKVQLYLWHGFTPMFFLSLLTLGVGGLVFSLSRWVLPFGGRLTQTLGVIGPGALYQRGLDAALRIAAWQTRLLQSGYLRVYVLFIVITTVALALITKLTRLGAGIPIGLWSPPRFYDVILIGILIIAAIQVTRTRSRLATIALLGSIGYSIAILFLLYSAPDLAMVQFAIETLTVILFVLIIYRLPKFTQLTRPLPRLFDIVIALAGGGMMTLLMLLVSSHPSEPSLANFYAANSLVKAFGRNIVNVILVDFRGLDTLGEITVLAIAAIGVFALIGLSSKEQRRSQSTPRLLQRSILLQISARYMMPLIMIFSVFLLIRGHNQIGGGFVAGLVAASALMLYAIAVSPEALRQRLPLKPRTLVSLGLLIALFSGMLPLLFDRPFMTGLWLQDPIVVIGKVGTPILFDTGVYLTVIGVVIWILLTFSEEEG